MLVLSRNRGDGVRLEIKPSENSTFVDILVNEFRSNGNGGDCVRLGFIAKPEDVLILRHNAMYGDEILSIPTAWMSETDYNALKRVASVLPKRGEKD